jgi:hypothetical protein
MRSLMSKQLFLVVAAAALAQLSAATLGLSAQEPPQIQQPYEPADVSEKDLRAFAKCYVEFHKIRTEYEPAFQGAHSPQEKSKVERDAVAKFGNAVEKQGLTLQRYAQIFKSVSADEQLRDRAMKLISEERGKS